MLNCTHRLTVIGEHRKTKARIVVGYAEGVSREQMEEYASDQGWHVGAIDDDTDATVTERRFEAIAPGEEPQFSGYDENGAANYTRDV